VTRGETLRRAAKFKKSKDTSLVGHGVVLAVMVSVMSLILFAGDLTEVFRSDRLAHFFVACILTQVFFLIGPSRRFQAVEALVLVLCLGVTKEISDPQMEIFDLIMNLSGTLFALAIHSLDFGLCHRNLRHSSRH
jgi:VanZ family protein